MEYQLREARDRGATRARITRNTKNAPMEALTRSMMFSSVQFCPILRWVGDTVSECKAELFALRLEQIAPSFPNCLAFELNSGTLEEEDYAAFPKLQEQRPRRKGSSCKPTNVNLFRSCGT